MVYRTDATIILLSMHQIDYNVRVEYVGVRRPRVSWMTAGDDRILETLEDSQLALTPRVLAYNVNYTRNYMSKRLAKLLAAGLVDRVDDDGFYRITEFGQSYLYGELEASDVELDDL